MKITITTDGKPRSYPVDFDFTFEEDAAMKDVAGIRAGELFGEILRGDVMATLAVAIVARMRAEPGFDPWTMRSEKIEDIELDLSEDGQTGPPAEAGAKPADGARGGKRSPRKS